MESLIKIEVEIAKAYIQQGFPDHLAGFYTYLGSIPIKESGRTIRRHSSFYIGLYGSNWVDFMENSYELVAELMTLAPNKRKYYQQGERAMRLILSAS